MDGSFTTAVTPDVRTTQEHNDGTFTGPNVLTHVKSLILYKLAEAIDKSYFPILVPIGVTGNILSFVVMIQPRNRHMSFSLYICVLAVMDTVSLLIGFLRYLNKMHGLASNNHSTFCKSVSTIHFMSSMCSTLFILSMTFDRFYSIMVPHKSASFNTVKRAKITILIIVLFSVLYNIPHAFITGNSGRNCNAYGKAGILTYGELYYWFSFVLNFALPFLLLLIMNSFIIHALRKRQFKFTAKASSSEGEGQDQGRCLRYRNAESQIYVTLLLVTFSFLILMAPAYVYALILHVVSVDYEKSAYSYAGYYLFYQIVQKLYVTNYGINFFLYVMSGRKFRTEFVQLLKCNNKMDDELCS